MGNPGTAGCCCWVGLLVAMQPATMAAQARLTWLHNPCAHSEMMYLQLIMSFVCVAQHLQCDRLCWCSCVTDIQLLIAFADVRFVASLCSLSAVPLNSSCCWLHCATLFPSRSPDDVCCGLARSSISRSATLFTAQQQAWVVRPACTLAGRE